VTKIGACWFDDISIAQGGWSSIDGAESQRISSYSELRTDVIWVTNLDYNAYKKLNLTQSPHIYDAQYFRTSLKLIGSENGLLHDVRALVEFASCIFSRVIRLGYELFDVDMTNPGYRYYSIIANRIMPGFMRKRPEGANVIDVIEGIKQATQANQAMSGIKAPKNSTAHDFAFPRGAYARWILTQKYPGPGRWEEIKRQTNETIFGVENGVVIKGSAGVIEKLKSWDDEYSVFLRINILNMDPQYRSFASFGSGSSYPRRWATLPEVLNLSRFCKIAIMGGYRIKSEPLKIAESIDFDSNEYSYSRGLLYENLWVALANPIYGNDLKPAVGAYMRAYDRFACSRIAEKFSGYQYVVGSYGTGRVMVYLTKQEEYQAAEFALSLGILPPMHMINGESK
jgi:hypothetical protein